MTESKSSPESSRQEFTDESRRGRTSLPGEVWLWLKHNKKWWLLPIIIVLLLLGLIVILGGSGLAPFIYPLI